MSKKEINYWPYAILGIIGTVVFLSVWTIRIAIHNPVEESNDYMLKYQEVDENINEILEKKANFDRKYRIDLNGNHLKLGENRVSLKVTDRQGRPVGDLNVTVVVQRPNTNRDNITLQASYHNGRYETPAFKISKIGRWNIDVRAAKGDAVGFAKWKSFVR